MKFIIEVINSTISLIAGLIVTLINFIRKPITTQYPYQRRKLSDRFRGFLKWDSDTCNGCEVCIRFCPANAIEIKTVKEDKKKKVEEIKINLGLCIYCGLCVENCPTNSLSNRKEYEYARYNKEELIWLFRKE